MSLVEELSTVVHRYRELTWYSLCVNVADGACGRYHSLGRSEGSSSALELSVSMIVGSLCAVSCLVQYFSELCFAVNTTLERVILRFLLYYTLQLEVAPSVQMTETSPMFGM